MQKSFFEYCGGDRIEVEIPRGFKYLEGSIEDGYVIEDKEGNQYIRIPSGYTSNGEFVRGFWVSRYEISKNEKGKPCSVPNKYPIVKINYIEAQRLAKQLEEGALPSGTEYNRICMWLVSTKAATFEQVFLHSNGMGNFSKPFVLSKTGSNPKWMFNKLDNFFGNCFIWTTEKFELHGGYRVIRGGHISCSKTGENCPPTCRAWADPNKGKGNITLRIIIHDARSEDDED